MTYDVLICTIPHRHEKLCALLAELDQQAQPGFGVLVYRDNLENSYRDKYQALLEHSLADYISYVDDDDWLAPGFVRRVMKAMEHKPDYIGYEVLWTIDGVRQRPVEHSLRNFDWEDRPDRLLRDIDKFNPIRRELALLADFRKYAHDHGADRYWAFQLRRTGKVQSEVFFPEPMYHYRFSSEDSFLSRREPMPAEDIPPLPAYPWLTVL